MSTPPTLSLPRGVEASVATTARGEFATLHAGPATARGSDDARTRMHQTMLLLPGWTGSKEDFIVLLPLLAERGWHAVAYDQRGQHETPGADQDDYSLPGLAADACAVADAVAAEVPVDLVGHSVGGLVAQQAVIAMPQRWRTLTLLCSGPGGFTDPGRTALLHSTADAIEHQTLEEVYEAKVRHDNSRDRKGTEPPEEVQRFLRHRFLRNTPASLAALTRHLAAAADQVDAVATLPLPRHVVYGEDDDGWPPDVQQQMAQRLGVPAHVVRDSAHSPNVENPTVLADLMDSLLP